MSGTSPGRKRKIRQQSVAQSPTRISKETNSVSPSRSAVQAASPPDSPKTKTEQGVLTSCKRVKPNSNGRRGELNASSRSEGNVILPPNKPSNKSSSGNIISDGLNKAKVWLHENYFRGPSKSLPDHRTIHDGDAVPINTPGTMPGRLGQFRPTNRLKQDKKVSTTPRPPLKRVFDFSLSSEEAFQQAPNPALSKKQKTGPEISLERNHADGFNDLYEMDDANVSSLQGSSGSKSVQSLELRQAQVALPSFGGVDEYRRVEDAVGFKKMRKNWEKGKKASTKSLPAQSQLKAKPSMFSASGSGQQAENQTTILIEGDDDEIQECSPQPMRYLGTASLVPPKNKSRETRPFRQERSNDESQSRYFQKKQSRQPFNGASSSSATSSGPFTNAATSSVRRGNSRALEISLEDSESELDPLAEGHETRTKQQAPNDSKTAISMLDSQSVSTTGDIHPSALSKYRPQPSRTKTTPKFSGRTFPISYIQTGDITWPPGFERNKRRQQCELRLIESTEHFEPFLDGEPVSPELPGFVIEPRLIHRVKFSDESSTIQIFRPAGLGISARLLLEIEGPTSMKFLQKLQSMNSNIHLQKVKADELSRIFAKQAEVAAANSSRRQETDLLQTRQFRRQQQARVNEVVQVSNHPSRRGSTNNDDEESNISRRRSSETIIPSSCVRQSIKSKLQANNIPQPKEPLTAHNIESMSQEEVFPDISLIVSGTKPTTRSSARNQSQEQKENPPELLRWTEQNPKWRTEIEWNSSLVYPPEGKRQTNVDLDDIERLDEGIFLNDQLIQFYLRYLEDQLEKQYPEIAKRIYFQNTYFFTALTKGKSIRNGINYDAVKRWTAKIDLFEYDYIIVPVNEMQHWYLAIIYNAPKLVRPDEEEIVDSQEANEPVRKRSSSPELSQGVNNMTLEDSKRQQLNQMSSENREDVDGWPESDPIPKHRPMFTLELDGSGPEFLTAAKEAPVGINNNAEKSKTPSKGRKLKRKSVSARKFDLKEPKIITLDSLGNAHSGTCVKLREYLVCEARERHGLDISTPPKLGLTVKDIPEQTNFSDCGIYVLGYIEKFLQDPDTFVRCILQPEEGFKNDWSGMNSSTLRERIRDLIFSLQHEQTWREKEQRKAKRATKSAKMGKRPSRTITAEIEISNQDSSTPISPSHSLISLEEPDHSNVSKSENGVDAHAKIGASNQSNVIAPISPDKSAAAVDFGKGVAESSFTKWSHDAAQISASSMMKVTVKKLDYQVASTIAHDEDELPETSALSPPKSSTDVPKTQDNIFKKFARSVDAEVVITSSSKRIGASQAAPVEIDGSFDGQQYPQRNAPWEESSQEEHFEDLLAWNGKTAQGKKPLKSLSKTPPQTTRVGTRKETRSNS